MFRFEKVFACSKRDIVGWAFLRFGKYWGVSGAPGTFGPHGNSFKAVTHIINLYNDRGGVGILAAVVKLNGVIAHDHAGTRDEVGFGQGLADSLLFEACCAFQGIMSQPRLGSLSEI